MTSFGISRAQERIPPRSELNPVKQWVYFRSTARAGLRPRLTGDPTLTKPKTIVVTIPGMIGDTDLAPLRAASDVTYCELPSISETDLAERCRGYDYLMLNMDVLPKTGNLKLTPLFYSHPGTTQLRGVAVDMTGVDYFSPRLAAERGLLLQNIPHYSSQSVAESILAEVLLHSRQRHLAYEDQLQGKKPVARKGVNLSGRTAGIVGYGDIGRTLSGLLQGVGMKVIVWNRSPRSGVTQVGLEELFERSDVVAVTAKTVTDGPGKNVGMIGSRQLSRARGAIVVNLANPLLVDAPAMVQALASGNVAAYSVESPDRKALGDDPRVHCAPTNAWDSDESMATLRATWVSNVLSAIRGKPENAYRE
jgi:glycerate dehydrogenase